MPIIQVSFLIRCIERDGKPRFIIENVQNGERKLVVSLLEAMLWIENCMVICVKNEINLPEFY
jgi:hypothetical protein